MIDIPSWNQTSNVHIPLQEFIFNRKVHFTTLSSRFESQIPAFSFVDSCLKQETKSECSQSCFRRIFPIEIPFYSGNEFRTVNEKDTVDVLRNFQTLPQWPSSIMIRKTQT